MDLTKKRNLLLAALAVATVCYAVTAEAVGAPHRARVEVVCMDAAEMHRRLEASGEKFHSYGKAGEDTGSALYLSDNGAYTILGLRPSQKLACILTTGYNWKQKKQ